MAPCANTACMLISLFPVNRLSQQQRKEREMVRQQEKGPHRRLDDMRREEDRRLAEREQVTNRRRCGAASANRCQVWACPPAAQCKSLWW